MKTQRPVIDSIKLKIIPDEYPDLSWLGEYSDKIPARADLRRGDLIFRHKAGAREYKYFIPAAGKVEKVRKDLSRAGHSRGVAEEMARRQARDDFERMEGYGSSWSMVGIEAEAVVKYRIGNRGDWRLETLTSGGLWGIESDSGRDYFEQVFRDELTDLREHLFCFGVRVGKAEWEKLALEAIQKANI